MFENIKTFDWEELDGKEVVVQVGKDKSPLGEMVVVYLYDKDGSKMYLIHHEFTPTIN